jgi:hypothetical protein
MTLSRKTHNSCSKNAVNTLFPFLQSKGKVKVYPVEGSAFHRKIRKKGTLDKENSLSDLFILRFNEG